MNKYLFINNKKICEFKIAKAFKERLLGYMFKSYPHTSAIVLYPCNSIHTFFMKFEIDVIFLDENMNILLIIDRLKPRKIILPVKNAKYVIEGKAGIFRSVKIGDTIEIAGNP